MRQYAFLDWNLVTSTPVERTYCRGLHPHRAVRFTISVGVLLIVVTLGFLFRGIRNPQAAALPAQPPPVQPTQLTPSDNLRATSPNGQQTHNADPRERSTGVPANVTSSSDVDASPSQNSKRTTGVLGRFGGVVYWGTVGALGVLAVVFPIGVLWQRVSLEWDGKDHLSVTSHKWWPSRQSWSLDDIGGIAFGIRERVDRPVKGPAVHRGWFWFVHLLGKPVGGTSHGRILTEMLVAHQHESPASETGRAVVPHKVKDLVGWLEECTHQRARSPVLLADKRS